jgi:hypothetical protein
VTYLICTSAAWLVLSIIAAVTDGTKQPVCWAFLVAAVVNSVGATVIRELKK